MRLISILLITLVAAALAPACGGDGGGDGACSSSDECAAGMICAGFGYESEGTCETPCDAQGACPSGKTCVENGNSCSGCEDIVSVCQ